jgi:hypothetical protein
MLIKQVVNKIILVICHKIYKIILIIKILKISIFNIIIKDNPFLTIKMVFFRIFNQIKAKT